MQLFTSDIDSIRDYIISDITHIRACSGHDPCYRINYHAMFQHRQQLTQTRDGYHRSCDHSGPNYVYYYTDLAGLSEIWNSDGIRPESVRYGMRSRSMIYCSPTLINDPDCPDACTAHKDKFKIQITIQLDMIIHDGIECYYTDDGFIAIRTEYLGMAYVNQIISIDSGAYHFVRPFEITDHHWTQRATRITDPRDTRISRSIVREPCYVCNTDMWLGMVTCIQCGNPICYDESLPTHNPGMTGLPATSTCAYTGKKARIIKEGMADGRKAKGMLFNVTYRIRLPGNSTVRSIGRTGRRAYAQQAQRYDEHQRRTHRGLYLNGATPYETIEERIQNDYNFRLRTAKLIVNSNQNLAPAQVLKSGICRMAFELALNNGELSYESIGKRVRTETATATE